MKKQGLVMEIKDKNLIVLTSSGEFLEMPLPANIPEVGDYIQLQTQPRQVFIKKFVGIAALFLLTFSTIFYYLFFFSQPSIVVALDINPSIELYADSKEYIKKAVPLNEDGENILKSVSIKGLSLEKGIEKYFQECIKQDYISEQKDNLIILSVINLEENSQKTTLDDLEKKITNSLERDNISGEIISEKSSKVEWQEAKKNNISVNKLKIINKLAEKEKSEIPKDLTNKSIKKILKENNLQTEAVFNHIKHVQAEDRDKLEEKIEKELDKKDKSKDKLREKIKKELDKQEEKIKKELDKKDKSKDKLEEKIKKQLDKQEEKIKKELDKKDKAKDKLEDKIKEKLDKNNKAQDKLEEKIKKEKEKKDRDQVKLEERINKELDKKEKAKNKLEEKIKKEQEKNRS